MTTVNDQTESPRGSDMNHRTANRIVMEVGFHTFRWFVQDGKLIGKTWQRKCKYPARIIARAWMSRTIYLPVDTRLVTVRFGATWTERANEKHHKESSV